MTPENSTSVDERVEHVDGRSARGARTRKAILDALYELLQEGRGGTGARAIAERAGVSPRSVFQHFEDLEAVYGELAARQEGALNPYLAPVDPLVPIVERVDRLVAARDEMYTIMAPIHRALNVHYTARKSPLVRNNLNRLHQALREQVTATFPDEVARDERLLTQIDVCLSFESWDQFTSRHGLTRTDARGHLAGLVMSLIAR